MPRIPGHPLSRFLGPQVGPEAIADQEVLTLLVDADVILGRELGTDREFVVFGRDVLQRVADGTDTADGYNVLCIEIDRQPGSPDLELLIELVTSIKGRHDFVAYDGSEP